jgi:carbon monoxide dehydrogenase subunit G
MVTTSLKVDINRPVPEVYQFLMKLDNYLLWQAGLVDIKATDGMATGSVISFTSIGLGKRFTLKAQVKENDGQSSFTVVSSRGPIAFESTYRLEEHGNGTRVELRNNINTGGVFKLAESTLQSISNGRYESDLNVLKAILDAQS